jgi:hypothetical protein
VIRCPPLPAVTEHKEPPDFWTGGTLGQLDVKSAYHRQLALGCQLLNGEWPSVFIPGVHFMPAKPSINVESADLAWIIAWKFMTKWGWFGYGGVAVLWMMSGGNAFLEFIDWWLIMWPCLIFTLVAVIARWRVGWPILLVNLWVLTNIVKHILIWVCIVCSAGLLLHWLSGLLSSRK